MNSVCIWKKQLSKHTKDKGYLTGCHIWINKNCFALDEIKYCPLCGGEMDLYISPEEIKEKQKNTPNFLYIKEEYFEKNLKNIKNCKGERCGKNNDSYYYILRYTTQNEYYNFKNFLKDNGYSINTCLARSGKWHFKESPAIIKKRKV